MIPPSDRSLSSPLILLSAEGSPAVIIFLRTEPSSFAIMNPRRPVNPVCSHVRRVPLPRGSSSHVTVVRSSSLPPRHVNRSREGSRTSSTSQSTTPFQPTVGLPTNLKCVPTTAANPTGLPPCPVDVHKGTTSGSVKARQTVSGSSG